jgi:hypothetical protein
MNSYQITKELLRTRYLSIPLLISLNRKLNGNMDLVKRIISFIDRNRNRYFYDDIKPLLEPIIEIGNNILMRDKKDFNIIISNFTDKEFEILYEVLIDILNIFNDLEYRHQEINYDNQSFIINGRNKYVNRRFIINYQIGRRKGSSLNKGHIKFSLNIQR